MAKIRNIKNTLMCFSICPYKTGTINTEKHW